MLLVARLQQNLPPIDEFLCSVSVEKFENSQQLHLETEMKISESHQLQLRPPRQSSSDHCVD